MWSWKNLFFGNQKEPASPSKEEVFKILADSAPVLIWISDPYKNRYFFNKTWLEYTGRSFEQEKGSGWEEGLHPCDKKEFLETYNKAFLERKSFELEYRLRDSKGNYRWILSRGIPLYNADKEFLGYIGCCIDIDERKKSQEKTDESEATKAAILNTAIDAIISIDEEGMVTQWNHSAEKIFGFSETEVLGKGLSSLIIPPSVKMKHDEAIQKYLQTGESKILDKRIVTTAMRKNGSEFPVELTATHVKSGGKNYFTAYIRDITENEASRIRLTESELNFRNLAEAMPQIVWTATPDGRVDYANKNWELTTGKSFSSMSGHWGECVHPDDLPELSKQWEHSILTGEPFEFEFRLQCINNNYRWHLSRGKAAKNDLNIVTKWHGTCTDIHDAKEYQIELKKAKETAEAANKAKDRFLAILSHELRNPLSPVLMAVSSLEAEVKKDTCARFHEDLAIIKKNVELEARLIDDLLDLSRIINNKYTLHKEKICLNDIINSLREGLLMQSKGRNISFTIKLNAVKSCVEADPLRIRQVINNFTSNAIKFTPDYGNITISTYNTDDDHVRLEVTDSGIGISENALPKIFNPFEQGDTVVGSRFGGLGLGLAISKNLIDLHGGRIFAKSEGRSKGATFGFDLCCVLPNPTASPIPKSKTINLPKKSLNILVVEDNEDTNKIMRRLLQSLNYNVDSAFSVKEAIEKVNSQHFNIVISDIGLPDGSGLQVAEHLKGSATKCVALSGFGMEDDIIKSREAGFLDHLVKPINFEAMQEIINKLIE